MLSLLMLLMPNACRRLGIIGTGSNTTLDGGTEFVVSSGFAFQTQVNSGGVQAVYGPGPNLFPSFGPLFSTEAESTTINPGGTEVISGLGSLDVGAVVSGVQLVLNGGTTSAALVEAGGDQVVEAFGTARATVIDGGTMEIQQFGATAFFVPTFPGVIFPPVLTSVTFTSNGGILQLDDSQNIDGGLPMSPIVGFGSPPGVTEEIDLRDISFGPGTTETYSGSTSGSTTSGTLTVTNGSQTANLTLLGQYSTVNFSLSSDGHGGTIITDPPTLVGSAASPVLAAQHT
jgi:autotransporter passenger strand-loop-strand repeat protein